MLRHVRTLLIATMLLLMLLSCQQPDNLPGQDVPSPDFPVQKEEIFSIQYEYAVSLDSYRQYSEGPLWQSADGNTLYIVFMTITNNANMQIDLDKLTGMPSITLANGNKYFSRWWSGIHSPQPQVSLMPGQSQVIEVIFETLETETISGAIIEFCYDDTDYGYNSELDFTPSLVVPDPYIVPVDGSSLEAEMKGLWIGRGDNTGLVYAVYYFDGEGSVTWLEDNHYGKGTYHVVDDSTILFSSPDRIPSVMHFAMPIEQAIGDGAILCENDMLRYTLHDAEAASLDALSLDRLKGPVWQEDPEVFTSNKFQYVDGSLAAGSMNIDGLPVGRFAGIYATDNVLQVVDMDGGRHYGLAFFYSTNNKTYLFWKDIFFEEVPE